MSNSCVDCPEFVSCDEIHTILEAIYAKCINNRDWIIEIEPNE
jgi:hypothetical protein